MVAVCPLPTRKLSSPRRPGRIAAELASSVPQPDDGLQLVAVACAAGHAAVVLRNRRVVAVALGDAPAAAAAAARAPIAAGRWVEVDEHAALCGRQVAGLAAAAADEGPPLPVSLGGTSFQRRVWQALLDIPAGATLTYRGLAERLGSAAAARAVAGACAANPLAIVVPCHRIVRRDGGLGGYRWGAQRKRALLANEAAASRDGART